MNRQNDLWGAVGVTALLVAVLAAIVYRLARDLERETRTRSMEVGSAFHQIGALGIAWQADEELRAIIKRMEGEISDLMQWRVAQAMARTPNEPHTPNLEGDVNPPSTFAEGEQTLTIWNRKSDSDTKKNQETTQSAALQIEDNCDAYD